MELLVCRKLDNGKRSDDVEKIHINDIDGIYTEGKNATVVYLSKDGIEYYQAATFGNIKKAIELFGDNKEKFQLVDRNYIVNVSRISYYEKDKNQIVIEHTEKNSVVPIAWKYINVVKKLLQIMKIEIK